MLSCNLFRALPPVRPRDADAYDLEEEEPALEPSWPHLQARGEGLTHCTAGRARAGEPESPP
jgi:hypothetical protein